MILTKELLLAALKQADPKTLRDFVTALSYSDPATYELLDELGLV